MRLLAFDTSTDTLSIALSSTVAGVPRRWQHSGAGGAQASATLVPAILDLMAQAGLRLGDLDAIAFGRGPGAVTGLRTACAVAQGLAFGARARQMPAGQTLVLLPVPTLLAVAEEARYQGPPGVPLQVVALLDARMDEVYSACYAFDGQRWESRGADRLGRPESVSLDAGWAMAGNVFEAYGARLPPDAPRMMALPTAGAMLRLAPALLAAGKGVRPEQALPIYIRDQVAQTVAERAAVKAALLG